MDTSAGVRLLGVGVALLADFAQDDLFSTTAASNTPTDDADPAADDQQPQPPVESETPRLWRPGQDVRHDEHGPGWVWGSGLGRVTLRFEGPTTPPGPVRTLAVDDRQLHPADPPDWRPIA